MGVEPEAGRSELIVVVYPDDVNGAEVALRSHWKEQAGRALIVRRGTVIRRDRSGTVSYQSVQEINPRQAEWYGGVMGLVVASLLLVPLLIGDARELSLSPLHADLSEEFRSRVRASLPPNSSGIVFLVPERDVLSGLDEAGTLGGTVLHEVLPPGVGDRLKSAVGDQIAAAGH